MFSKRLVVTNDTDMSCWDRVGLKDKKTNLSIDRCRYPAWQCNPNVYFRFHSLSQKANCKKVHIVIQDHINDPNPILWDKLTTAWITRYEECHTMYVDDCIRFIEQNEDVKVGKDYILRLVVEHTPFMAELFVLGVFRKYNTGVLFYGSQPESDLKTMQYLSQDDKEEDDYHPKPHKYARTRDPQEQEESSKPFEEDIITLDNIATLFSNPKSFFINL